MTQTAIDGAAHDGLWRAVVANGEIVHGAWMHRRAQGEFIGTCRRCGDFLVPERPYDTAGRTDYEANCRNDACGYVMLAPGGRVLRHSAAKSLQQKGATA